MTVVAVDAYADAKREVVDALRGLLERAEAGELRSVYLAAMRTDGAMTTLSAGACNNFEIVAKLEYLKHRIITGE